MSRDGFANGAAGQVIFLHEFQTEVVFESAMFKTNLYKSNYMDVADLFFNM